MKQIAVITGASSGMGQEFARRFAQMGKDGTAPIQEVWLIARRRERLEALAKELPLPAKILTLDLCDSSAFDFYRCKLEEEQPRITLLLNCSGYGKFGLPEDIPQYETFGMIDLNCRAVVAMSELSLPYMDKGSEILQVASIAAFQPLPYMNVYAASKAFVLSYSLSLRTELRPRGISVMAICPGWTKTEFFDRAAYGQAEGANDAAIPNRKPLYTIDQVVKRSLKDRKKGRAVSICGFRVRTLIRTVKFLPKSLALRVWMRMQKHSAKAPKM